MRSQIKQQHGVALIVSLVILVLVTVAGVATMESTGMQLKMANASRDRQQAFEVAEAALRMVEEDINDNVDNLAEQDNFYENCSGTECFNWDCDGGRCFQGLWRDGDPVEQCKIIDDAEANGGTNTVDVPTTPVWQSGTDAGDLAFLNVWDDAAQHLSAAVDGYDNPARYVIEFRCFTSADPSVPMDVSNFAEVYRITARGMSDSGRIEVMLQSTYKRTD